MLSLDTQMTAAAEEKLPAGPTFPQNSLRIKTFLAPINTTSSAIPVLVVTHGILNISEFEQDPQKNKHKGCNKNKGKATSIHQITPYSNNA